MKLKITLLFLLVAVSLVSQQGDQLRFASFPCLTPDGSEVIYCYEGDIWKGDLKTKEVSRLTAMQGLETRPQVSPDGKWLAFSSAQYGNADVYVMPLAGGDITQLTYHDGGDFVESWTWDSKQINFRSGAFNGGTAYQVSREGGTPRRLFQHYFNRIHNVTFAPSGDIFFNDTWESENQAYRKRYKGSFNPDIQSYNPTTKQYKKHTDYAGKDMWPMIDRSGNIYFVSDEDNGHYNLYELKKGKKSKLTSFKESLKNPSIAANGSAIVFVKDYRLWIYDTKTEVAKPLELNFIRNQTLEKEKDYTVSGEITDYDISPDGKKMAFSSRGVLMVSDIKGKFVKQISANSKERVQEVRWINNDTLLFGQTVAGYQNWFMVHANGTQAAKQLTQDTKSNRQMSLNKKKDKAIYLSGRDELKMLNLKTLQAETLVKDEYWAIQSGTPQWSPNDEYVLYMAYRDFERDILLYHIDRKTSVNITNSGITESEAVWAPDGSAIYFTSDRMRPFYPFGNQEGHIYKLPLTKKSTPFRSDKFDELWAAKPAKDTSKVEKPIDIDLKDIMDRIEQVGASFGTQGDAYAILKDEKTTLLYLSTHDEGKPALWKYESEPFETPKNTKIADMTDYDIREVSGKYYILSGGKIGTFNGDFTKIDPIDINHKFRKNVADEFEQMFAETWAGVGENFYSESYHGTDWQALKKYYEAFVPHVNTRNDFREILQDMLGELNASHTGFSSFGDEEKVYHTNATVNVGLLFDDEKPYVVKQVVPGGPSDLTASKVMPGDILTMVNGKRVDPKMNRDVYFTMPSSDREISLTFSRADSSHTIKLSTLSSGGLNNLLYQQWIDDNQRYVDQKSKNRISYVHMRNMGLQEYDKFVVDMTRDFYKKDALILDLRYNTGGNVHDKVLNFLSQKPYLQWKYREGKLTNQPNFGPAGKPIVLLINEQSLSDAEMTAEGFKALKLGTVIGMETYRWIIFTSGKGLVDGSFYRLPSWGCYSLDGRNLELTGVAPDKVVPQTFTDRLTGKEPQLDAAISEILGKIK